MSWRLAGSLVVLRAEIRARMPGTTVWTLGDQAHASGWSDHNPNPRGVVCAVDVLADKGLDLGWFADRVRTSGHPALKYVIFNRRIASAGQEWRPYSGSNPHATHVHVSVGVGRDGRSTGPYDDTSSWQLWPPPASPQEDIVPITPQDCAAIARELLDTRVPSSAAGWPDPPPRVQDLLKQGLTARWETEAIRRLVEDAQAGRLDAGEVVDEIARRLGPTAPPPAGT